MKFEQTWFIFGIISYLLIFINIYKTSKNKIKGWELLVILSLIFGCIALLSEYHRTINAVVNDDVGYILDVIPWIKQPMTYAVGIGLFLNTILCIINYIKQKSI